MSTLIEGSDYFLHFVKLANKANPAMVVENQDGTYDVYLNTLYDSLALRDSLPHEFIHIADDHLFINLPIETIESQADARAEAVIFTAFGVKVPLCRKN